MKKKQCNNFSPLGKGFKMLLVMKLTTLLMIFTTLQATATLYSQTVRVDIDVSEASIESVFEQIRRQSELTFIYNTHDLETVGKITLNRKDVSVEDLLETCLKDSGITFILKENVIILRKDQQQAQQTGSPIKGIVKDASGAPMVGVTVVVKGSTIGTMTDRTGSFTINANRGDILVFTFIGMRTVEVTYNDQESIQIKMEEDLSEIEEVVVTGYQVINRKQMTSAINTYKMEDLNTIGVTTLDAMLNGRILDMTFTSNSGEVGVVPKLRIRGTSTLIGNREPLWVVDGIVVTDPIPLSADVLNDPDYVNRIGNAIAGINPQDIESLNVLKDAAATTLYGTRAANGVIEITTKKGQSGRSVISYSGNTTMKLRPRYSDKRINLMSGSERLRLSRDFVSSGYIYPSDMNPVGYEYLLKGLYEGRLNDAQFADEIKKLENTDTDWFDILTKDSFSHDHSINMSGGSEQIRYYTSIGYTRSNDVVRGQYNDRYTATINLNTDLYKWFKAFFSLRGSIEKRSYHQDGINAINYAYNTSRIIPAYNEDGEYHYYLKNASSYSCYNYSILNEIDNSSNTQRGNGLTLSTKLDFIVTDWLRANVQFSYSTQNTDRENYWGERSYYATTIRESEYNVEPPYNSGLPFGGIYSYSNNRNNNYTLRAQVDINKSFGAEQNHGVFGSVGYEMSSSRGEGYSATTRGYYKERGRKFVTNMRLADDVYTDFDNWLYGNVPTITDNLNNTIGVYATATYSYDNLFNINANARYDGSNQFGSRSNDKMLPVWSVSGSINLSEVGSIRNINWINYMRLKTSYGFQGNMLNDQNPELTIINGAKDAYYGAYTSNIASFPNPDLKWEKTGSFNVGLEMSLLDDRVQISGDYYRKRTEDAFMEKTISTVNGRESYIINGGIVLNNGFNVELTVIPIKTLNSRWVVSTAFSKIYNKQDEIPGAETYELSNFLNGTALIKGKPISTFYSYKFAGLSPVDGAPLIDDHSDYIDKLVGMSKYETYTTVLTASGRREPTISGNINSTFSYKNFRVSTVFAYALGAKIRKMSIQQQGVNTSSNRLLYPEFNASREFLDRWKVPGDELTTNIPALLGASDPKYDSYNFHWSWLTDYTSTEGNFIATNYFDMYDYSDVRVVRADYLKLSNFSFTYSLPKKLLDRISLSRMEVTLSITNLFTITHKALKGQTPTQSTVQTVSLSDRPTFSLGLNLSL